MKDYACYLFDADGTLIDTRELIYQSFLHLTGELGVPAPARKDLDASIGLTLRAQLETFLGPGRGEDYYAEAGRIYNRHHLGEYGRYVAAFPGAREGLEALAGAGKTLAVVTSRSRRSIDLFLDALDLRKYFALVVAAEDTERHKPLPDPALKAMALLRADPRDTVFIGDAEFDMSCGKSAGVDAVYAAWGGMDRANWPVQPDFVAREFRDLLPDAQGPATK